MDTWKLYYEILDDFDKSQDWYLFKKTSLFNKIYLILPLSLYFITILIIYINGLLDAYIYITFSTIIISILYLRKYKNNINLEFKNLDINIANKYKFYDFTYLKYLYFIEKVDNKLSKDNIDNIILIAEIERDNSEFKYVNIPILTIIISIVIGLTIQFVDKNELIIISFFVIGLLFAIAFLTLPKKKSYDELIKFLILIKLK